jgi:hypothetical protein
VEGDTGVWDTFEIINDKISRGFFPMELLIFELKYDQKERECKRI